jgi:hypothetical protein
VSASTPPGSGPPRRNCDVRWDDFDTGGYLADNYATLHELDRQIINVLSPYYAGLPPDGLAATLDVGTGPNLYPLMLAAAASRRLESVEPSAANRAYLHTLCEQGPDDCWHEFWRLCRELNPALPVDLGQVLAGVRIRRGDAFTLPPARYDMVSMFFVAESVTGVREEFEGICRGFASAAAPGGHLVAAFMAGMPSYELGGKVLPSYPIDEGALAAALRGLVQELDVRRLPPDPTLPYEHDGVLLLTARAV